MAREVTQERRTPFGPHAELSGALWVAELGRKLEVTRVNSL